MRTMLPIAMIMLAACHTVPKPNAPKLAAREQPVRTRPDTFVQSYRESIARTRDALAAKDLEADLAAIRAAVDAHLTGGNYTLQATGANAAVLRRLRVDSMTNSLVTYGYRRVHIADAGQARRLVRATAGVFGSPSNEGDIAAVAPTVVLAHLVRVDEPADGSATLVYRVVEPLKNASGKDSLIRLTIRAPHAPSPFPPPPQPGEGELRLPGRAVLFLSPPRGVGEMLGANDQYARITQPMRLDGDLLTPGYHSDAPEITLTRLRAVIREQVCAPGFVAAGAKGISLPC